jgi:hypothetical protein
MAKTPRHARPEAGQRFRALVREAVTPDDVRAICRMLAESARQGNVIAAKLLFNYLGGTPGVLPPAAAPGGGVRIFLPALQESAPDSASDVPADATAADAAAHP